MTHLLVLAFIAVLVVGTLPRAISVPVRMGRK